MAAGANRLWLVRNAVSSSRALVHADSVVVVPARLTLWKITHVIWSFTLLPFHFLFVCVCEIAYLLSLLFCRACSVVDVVDYALEGIYGWQWLIDLFYFFQNIAILFFLNSYFNSDRFEYYFIGVFMENWNCRDRDNGKILDEAYS